MDIDVEHRPEQREGAPGDAAPLPGRRGVTGQRLIPWSRLARRQTMLWCRWSRRCDDHHCAINHRPRHCASCQTSSTGSVTGASRVHDVAHRCNCTSSAWARPVQVKSLGGSLPGGTAQPGAYCWRATSTLSTCAAAPTSRVSPPDAFALAGTSDAQSAPAPVRNAPESIWRAGLRALSSNALRCSRRPGDAAPRRALRPRQEQARTTTPGREHRIPRRRRRRGTGPGSQRCC